MKKTVLFIIFTCIAAFGFLPDDCRAEDTNAKTRDVVHIIPIRDNIEGALLYVIRRGIKQAEKDNAAAIIFEMDTNGGELQAADEIVRMLLKIKVPTYTFVNTKAFSAGAIIALATDHIYMAPGSVIGAATPIMMSPFSGAQEMPESVEEKMSSAVSALVRAAAQEKGHDPALAEAMIRKDAEYKIGDTLISKEGELLTLTNIEAEQLVGDGETTHHLLSEGTVRNIDELLEKLGLSDFQKSEFEVSTVEKIARIIKSASVLLLAGGLLGVYIEIKTPGFGLPGILGVLLLMVFFWGHHIAGLAGMEELILFFLGVILLALEVFVIPGFGITGILGLTMMAAGVIAAMMPQFPIFSPGSISLSDNSFAYPFKIFASAVIIAGGGALILSKFLPRNRAFRQLVLDNSQFQNQGFGSHEDLKSLIGTTGVAVTGLRPGGTGMFDDKRLDIITRGDFIEPNTRIKIVDVDGASLFVEEIQEG